VAGADRARDEEMQRHYSTVGLNEERSAIPGRLQVLAAAGKAARDGEGRANLTESLNFGVNRAETALRA
jgi:hypothetical protein